MIIRERMELLSLEFVNLIDLPRRYYLRALSRGLSEARQVARENGEEELL
jgi:hypothetical protein